MQSSAQHLNTLPQLMRDVKKFIGPHIKMASELIGPFVNLPAEVEGKVFVGEGAHKYGLCEDATYPEVSRFHLLSQVDQSNVSTSARCCSYIGAIMDITYREAMPLDLPVLVSMERTLFADSPWSMGQFREEFSGIPKTRYFLVALDSDKQIVGYAGVMVVASGVDADVLTVAVLPEARRQGIARHFMDSLEKWSLMRVAPSMILEVGVKNSSAIALYESLGYSIINTRKNYYGPGLDAHVMKKELS